jgi:hypothetical protein
MKKVRLLDYDGKFGRDVEIDNPGVGYPDAIIEGGNVYVMDRKTRITSLLHYHRVNAYVMPSKQQEMRGGQDGE